VSDNNEFDDGDFFEDDYVPTFNRWKLVGAGLAVVIVAGFGIGIWYAYDQGVKQGVQLAPPIIKADNSPVKEQPEDPGGMEIPHQDKEVFNVLNGEKEEEKVEKLMEAPEEVIKDPAPVEIEKDEAQSGEGGAESLMTESKEETKTIAKEAAEKVEEAAEEVKEAASTAAQTVKEGAEEAVKKVEETTEKAAAAVEEKVAETLKEEPKKIAVAVPKADEIKGPAYRVQLGAFRSNDAAEKAWSDLQKKHAELLQGLPHKVHSVEITGKGVFYRLQAGAYANRDDANVLCGNLKKAKQDCLIAKN